MIEIIQGTPSHVIELRKNLRELDAQEIRNFGACIRRVLWMTFNQTLVPKTVLVDGKVAGMFGCGGTVIGQVGKPWMLATPIADQYPLQFALLYRQEVRKMLEHYPILENLVDASYIQAIRLLKLMGFMVYDNEPIHDGKFYKFRMVA